MMRPKRRMQLLVQKHIDKILLVQENEMFEKRKEKKERRKKIVEQLNLKRKER